MWDKISLSSSEEEMVQRKRERRGEELISPHRKSGYERHYIRSRRFHIWHLQRKITLFAGSQEAQRESLLVLELVLNLGERVSFRERCFSTSWAQDDNWAILSVDMIWRQEGCSFLDYLIKKRERYTYVILKNRSHSSSWFLLGSILESIQTLTASQKPSEFTGLSIHFHFWRKTSCTTEAKSSLGGRNYYYFFFIHMHNDWKKNRKQNHTS